MRNIFKFLSYALLFFVSVVADAQLLNNNLLGARRDPSNPNVVLGTDLDFWVNGSSTVNKTTSGNNPSAYIDGFTSDDPNALAFTNSGIAKAAFNGKFMTVFDGVGLAYTSLTRWNYLHNGAQDYTVGGRFNPVYATTAEFIPLLTTTNRGTTQRGVYFSYEKSSLATNGMLFRKSNGTALQVNKAWNNAFPNNNQWYTWYVTYTSSSGTYELFVDGTSQGTVVETGTDSSGDAFGNLTMFRFTSTGSFGKKVLHKHTFIAKKVLTSQNRSDLSSYFSFAPETIGDNGDADLDFLWGQSNMAGKPNIAGLPSYSTGVQQSYIYASTSAAYSAVITIAPLQAGVNNNDDGANTLYGPEMEFAYRIQAAYPSRMHIICKHAVSGSPLYALIGTQDWNTATANECVDDATNKLIHSWWIGKYELRKVVTLRSWYGRQGEADANSDNPNNSSAANVESHYLTDITNWYNTFVTRVNAVGISTAKMHTALSIIDNVFSPTRLYQSNIITSQNTFITNTSGVSHTTIDLTTSDGTHFNGTSMTETGNRGYVIIVPFRTE